MPGVITFDRGSKRRLRRVHWTIADRISVVVLFLLVAAVCIFAALWIAYYDSDSIPEHRLEVRR